MEPKTEPRPINQTAIHVDADDFAAKIAEMGDDALYQRFTVSRGKDESAGMEGAAVPETQDVPTGVETETRAPIDVSNDLLAEFSWGSPDSSTVQNWLQENGIQPGEEVTVRILGSDGVREQKVSTNRETFFVPVEKLVTQDTDEFDHAEIVAKKYSIGTPVVIGRNVYGPDGKMTGEKTPDTGWKVIGYGERNGVPTTKVQKIEGSQVLDKEPTNAELAAMQGEYGAEALKPRVSESLVRKTGHQELEAAGVHEPAAIEQQSEINEITQPKVPTSEPVVSQAVEEEVAAQPEKPVDKKQERYNDIKKAMDEAIEEVSDTNAGYAVLDALRLDDYAKAVHAGDHNAENRAVTGMSKKLISRPDLTNRYADLYKLKEDLFTLRP